MLLSSEMQNNGVSGSLEDLRLDNLSYGSVVLEDGVGVVDVRNVVSEKRSVVGEFYEHCFDPEFSFRIRFKKIGAGLENLGNTCYMNSVLQCLTYTEPFVAYLLTGKHKSTCRNDGFCAMCALHNHVMVALQSTGKILRPFHFVKNLGCISSNFEILGQEDAHEYMVNLLESMHKCCLPYGVSSESPSAYEKSQVHKIFGGQLRSQVKCMQCSYSSNKFDPFLDLSLDILEADSLKKALAHFTSVELLDDGERQFQCQRCNEKVKAIKKLTIQKAPYVLNIHLKRFDSTMDGEKLTKKVEYERTLNLNPYTSDPREGDCKYTLYGVLVHAGLTAYSGHYFCYVRTSAGMWYYLDDKQVTRVSEKTVLSQEAYMLFYVRDRMHGGNGAVEVTPKLDISSTSENEVLPIVERRPNAIVYSSVQTDYDEIHRERVPAIGSSSQQSGKLKGLFFHVNDQFETKFLPIGDDICTNEHETTPSQHLAMPIPSIDSKLRLDDDMKGDAIDDNAQDSALEYIKETNQSLLGEDFENILMRSNSTNDSIQMGAVGMMLVNDQSNGFESSSNDKQLQEGAESFLKLLETKPVESSPSGTTVCCAQQETHADIITEDILHSSHQTESKLRKLRKSLLAKARFFGRKKLFLMSLHLPKNTRMKSKKNHLASRKKFSKRMDNDSNTDSYGASTSENFQTIEACFSHLRRKHSHSTNRKSKGKESVKLCSTSVHNEEFNEGMSRFCSNEGDSSLVKCENAEGTDNQNFLSNLQMNSLKESSDAGRDDEDFSARQMNKREHNAKRNFNCLIDECDEDYDKVERKKLKKSRQFYFGSC